MSNPKDSGRGTASNRSVTRAVDILRELAGSPVPMTVTDIAKEVDLPRATAFRLLSTLEDEGFVDRQETLYSLGWDLVRIATAADPATGLRTRTGEVLDETADRLGETVTLQLRNGLYDVMMVVRSAPKSAGYAVFEVQGTRWPLHASASGKLLLAEFTDEEVRTIVGDVLEPTTEYTITDVDRLLAELATIRVNGWALNINETEDGIFSAAVPIRDTTGALVATLATSAPAYRTESKDRQMKIVEELLESADTVRGRMMALPSF